MADQDNLTLQLTVQTAKALQAMQEFQAAAEKSLSSVQATNERLSSSFGSLKTFAEAAIAAFAIEKVASYFTESVRLAGEQEATINRLNQSMANTGEYSDAAAADMKAFADQIQATTTFSNQAILAQLAVAKGFGLTNDESKNLVKAAAELSAALGIGLDQAVMQLQKTLSGTLVRLGEQYPALKQFSAAQLEAGAAVKFFADGLGTIAESQVKTYEGAMAQASNAQADFRRSLGEIVTENPVMLAAIKAFTDVFRNLKTEIDDNHDGLSTLVSGGIKLMAETVPAATATIEFLALALKGLVDGGGHAIADFEDIFAALGETIYVVVGPAVELIGRLEATILDMAGSMPGVSDAASAMGVNLKALAATVDQNRQDFAAAADSADKSVRQMADSTRDSTDKMVSDLGDFNDGLKKTMGIVDAAAKTVVDANESQDESARKKYENSGKYSRGAISDLKALEEEQKAAAELEKKLNQDALNALSPARKAETEWKSALEQIDKFVKDGVFSWQRAEEDKAKATSTYVDKINKINADAADKAQKDAERQAQALAQFLDGLDKYNASELQKADIERHDQLEKLQAFEDAGTIAHEEAVDRRLQIDEQYAAKRNQILSQDPTQIIGALANGDDISKQDVLAASLGGLNSALQGAQGAANLIAQSAGTLVNTFLPGLGSAVTGIIGVMEQGPDATKKFIEQFIAAIPDIMAAIGASMPEIVDGFIASLSKKDTWVAIGYMIFDGVTGGMRLWLPQVGKDLGVNFGDSLNSPNFSKTVHGWFSGVEENFGKLSAANIGKALEKDGDAISGKIKEAFDSLKEEIPALGNALRNGIDAGAMAAKQDFMEAIEELRKFPHELSEEVFVALPVKIRQGFIAGATEVRNALMAFDKALLNDLTVKAPRAIDEGFKQGAKELARGFDEGRAALVNFFGSTLPRDVHAAFETVIKDLKTVFLSDLPNEIKAIGGAVSSELKDAGGIVASDLKEAGGAVANGVKTQIGSAFAGARDELNAIFGPFRQALASFHFPEIPTPTWLKDFIDSVNHLTGSGGGGGGFVSDLKKGQVDLPGGHSIGVNGFHAAGLSEVPSGFPNDSYIGGLSTGEGVLDAQTNPAVKKMAQSYEADRSAMLAILGQLVTLMQQPQSVPVQLKVGTDVLATAMLKVSRTNQRVSP